MTTTSPEINHLGLVRFRSRSAGMMLLGTIIFIIVAGVLFFPGDPLSQDLSATLLSPASNELMGTDHLGRSVMARILHGGYYSLMISGICTGISLLIGTLLGAVAGYLEGWQDVLIMRLVDGLLAFPGTLLTIVLAGTLGGTIPILILALTATLWCDYCRLVRNMTRSLKHQPHVEAGKIIGFSVPFILRRYILPGLIPQVTTLASLSMGRTILNIASLGFLGIGLTPPTPEWGSMINQGIGYLSEAPWLVAGPGVMIFLTVFGCQLLAGSKRADHG